MIITNSDAETAEQQLAIKIGAIHVESHDRLQLEENESKQKVAALERVACEQGECQKKCF